MDKKLKKLMSDLTDLQFQYAKQNKNKIDDKYSMSIVNAFYEGDIERLKEIKNELKVKIG